MADQDTSQQRTETAANSSDPFLGRVIVGKFRLEGLLGVGAMGRVYEAVHLSLSKKIAVKVLHQHLMGDDDLARRFHREAKSASSLNHPNSISIMDFGQDTDGTLYIAMEFLEGRNLIDVLHADAPLPLDRTIHILSQVCLALGEAHHNNIVHRDLKAENVMVMERRDVSDFVKVCDFGIAKLLDPKGDNPDSAITVAGMVCGTPEYMSPEQARGDTLDGRSDLYSLGILLYYMVTDRLPFTAETALGCVTKHLTEAPTAPRDMRPDLRIPPVLDAFILRTIAKDPDLRPATASAFNQELAAVAERIAAGELGEPTPTSAASSTPTLDGAETLGQATSTDVGPGVGRSRGAFLWVLVAGILITAGAVGYWLTRPSDSPPPEAGSSALAKGSDGGTTLARNVSPPDAVAARRRPIPPTVQVTADAAAPAMGRRRHSRRRRGSVRRPRAEVQMRPMTPAVRPIGKTPFQEASEKARAAFNAGRVSAAARHYRAALGHKPGHVRSLKELGRCYVRLGRPCQALRYYKRYARVRPGDYFVTRHIKTLSPKCSGK